MNPIDEYCKKNELSCDAMATLTGLSKASVSRHRRGYPINGDSALSYKIHAGIPIETLMPFLTGKVSEMKNKTKDKLHA